MGILDSAGDVVCRGPGCRHECRRLALFAPLFGVSRWLCLICSAPQRLATGIGCGGPVRVGGMVVFLGVGGE